MRNKVLVAIATEEDGRGIGRIRMARIPRASKKVLQRFVREVIEPGSIVHTDGLPSYRGLETLGYQHEVSILLGQEKDAALRLLLRVHRVASLLKRWLLGTADAHGLYERYGFTRLASPESLMERMERMEKRSIRAPRR